MVELLCETDFVAKNEDFVALANQLAMHATAMQSELETIKEEAFLLNPEITIGVAIQEATQKLGERVEIGRMIRMTVGETQE
jgi:elongation factor Ts